MQILRALSLALFFVLITALAGQCWEFVDDDEGWCGGFSNNLTCSWLGPPHGWGGHLWLQPTGVDPYLVGPVGYNDKMFSAKACRYICLRMLVGFSSHATSEFYWRKGGTWYGRQFALTNTDGTQWVNYDLNMTQSPDWSGDISQIRLDPISPGHAGASILYDYVRPMYALDGSAYWGFDSDIEGWFATGNVGSYRAEGGYLKGTSTTADPYIYNYPGPTIDASYNNCIRVRMKTNAGTSAELYWAPWSYGYRSFPITSDNTFREYVLNMASTASWTGVTTYLRFDPSTANGCSFEIDYIQVFRDKVAPTGSVKINNDAPYTSGTSVTLNLSASDPDISQDHPIKKGSGVWQARYRNSGGSWGSWEAYTTSKAWTLPGGDGTKTVYAEFRDIAENVSSTYSDSIVLDTTPPSKPVVIDDGDYITSTSEIHASWSAADAQSGIAEYQYAISVNQSESGIIPGGAWKSAGTATEGIRTGLSLTPETVYYVLVKAKNGAGLWSSIGESDGIKVCTAPVITANPQASTVCAGQKATFNVQATGSQLNFQWQKKPSGGSWSDISGATSSSYTTPTLTAADNSCQYRCKVSSACMSGSTSASHTYTFEPLSVVGQFTEGGTQRDQAFNEEGMSPVMAGAASPTAGGHDLRSDTWVATDALGRKLPDYSECGPPRENKTVGMFYLAWHGEHGTEGPYDITKMIQANPQNPQYAGRWQWHWWGEPEAGYFRALDPWVVRRNLSMLADAGVDVLILDATNGWIYSNEYLLLCQIASEMKANGQTVPKLAFISWMVPEVVLQLWDSFYSQNLYSDLWFYWQGKPLMLGDPDRQMHDGTDLPQHIKNFFTWRQCWFQPSGYYAGYHKWTWGCWYPQDYAWDVPGVPEQVSVLPATHPIDNIGRSHHLGVQPPIDQYKLAPTTGDGIYFNDQWQRALEIDPAFIFVTAWNDWVGMRFTIPEDIAPGVMSMCGSLLNNIGDSYFIDDFNQEYSRDIEPMKGGHTDNYYYQMIANIRKYKGVRAPTPPSSQKTIAIDGSFSDWDSVQPEYLDTIGDTAHRNYPGWGTLHYTNNTGRNDIIKSKVARDANNIYFYVETKDNLTSYTGSGWMLLLIDADCNAATGWEGYDYIINLAPFNSTTTTVMKNTGGWNWAHVGEVSYRAVGKRMEIAVPRSYIKQDGSNAVFDFKWADSVFTAANPPGDVSGFFINGDTAPNRRADYRYATVKPGPIWEFKMDGNAESWDILVNSISSLRAEGGSLIGDITGIDPYIIDMNSTKIDANANRYIWIRMKINSGTRGEFYWATESEPNYSPSKTVNFSYNADGQFHDYVIDMSANSLWAGQAFSLRFDPSLDATSGHFEIDFIRVMRTPPPPPDTNAPTGGIVINSGAEYTNSRVVNLRLTATDIGSGVKSMRFSNNGTTWSEWQQFSLSESWTLSPNDGLKTVYVMYKDAAGNVSVSYSDTITLDTTTSSPVVYSNAVTLTVNTAPNITLHPESKTLMQGEKLTLSVEAGGTTPFSYQWRKNANVIPGATGSSYTVNKVMANDAGSYDCKVTNLCGSSTSNEATIMVEVLFIPDAKSKANGESVVLTSKPVTAIYSDYFYIEEINRTSGIRVVLPTGVPQGLKVGDVVDIWGVIKTTSDGERYIQAQAVTRV